MKKITALALTVLGAGALLSTTAARFADDPVPGANNNITASAGGGGIRGWELVTLPNANVPNFQRRTLYCPNHKRVLGGGAEARGNDAILVGSFPTDDGRGWIGLGRQNNFSTVGISVFAICAYTR